MLKLAYLSSEIIALYQSGLSLREVGEKYATSGSTIKALLKRNQITLRPRGVNCPHQFTKERRDALRERMPSTKGLRFAYRPRRAMPERCGENNPSWKGGKTALVLAIRTCTQYQNWRRQIYISAKHTCAICGVVANAQNKITLHCDHIIPLSQLLDQNQIRTIEEAVLCSSLWDTNNGRILCKCCHKATPTFGVNLCRKS